MSASANVCGNCANFKPKQGEKFFNCTYAQQAGVKYAMQVRADTRSCEAFSALNQPAKQPQAAPSKAPPPAKRTEPRRPGLCPWGRMVMLAAIIIIILLLAFGAYTCFKGSGTPAPTPTPTPTLTVPPTPVPTPTNVSTPTPTPTPIPVFTYNLGQWITAPPLLILAASAEKLAQYSAPGPQIAPAGTHFIFVTVTLTDAGINTITTAATDFAIVTTSGLYFPPIKPSGFLYNTYTYTPLTIYPGQTVSGRMIFIVPDVVTSLKLRTVTPNGIVEWNLPW